MNHEQKWKRIEAIEAELIELGKRQIELRNEHARLLMTRATRRDKVPVAVAQADGPTNLTERRRPRLTNFDPMKSSIRISRGGRSISFSGLAARQAFEGMTGTKLPASEVQKKMDPSRFTIGERVRYVNHVAKYGIAMLEVVSIDADTITAARFFDKDKTYTFHLNGVATHSPNLSIQHED